MNKDKYPEATKAAAAGTLTLLSFFLFHGASKVVLYSSPSIGYFFESVENKTRATTLQFTEAEYVQYTNRKRAISTGTS